ncbi:MAG: hypothetical protein AAFY26_06055 [Cyanobacteria bacterium J06638_22]
MQPTHSGQMDAKDEQAIAAHCFQRIPFPSALKVVVKSGGKSSYFHRYAFTKKTRAKILLITTSDPTDLMHWAKQDGFLGGRVLPDRTTTQAFFTFKGSTPLGQTEIVEGKVLSLNLTHLLGLRSLGIGNPACALEPLHENAMTGQGMVRPLLPKVTVNN